MALSCVHQPEKPQKTEPTNLSSSQKDSILTETGYLFSEPRSVDSTGMVMIPITTKQVEPDNYRRGIKQQSNNYPNYWNILFLDTETGMTNLLTDQKMGISHIHIIRKQIQDEENVMNNMILMVTAN